MCTNIYTLLNFGRPCSLQSRPEDIIGAKATRDQNLPTVRPVSGDGVDAHRLPDTEAIAGLSRRRAGSGAGVPSGPAPTTRTRLGQALENHLALVALFVLAAQGQIERAVGPAQEHRIGPDPNGYRFGPRR